MQFHREHGVIDGLRLADRRGSDCRTSCAAPKASRGFPGACGLGHHGRGSLSLRAPSRNVITLATSVKLSAPLEKVTSASSKNVSLGPSGPSYMLSQIMRRTRHGGSTDVISDQVRHRASDQGDQNRVKPTRTNVSVETRGTTRTRGQPGNQWLCSWWKLVRRPDPILWQLFLEETFCSQGVELQPYRDQ